MRTYPESWPRDDEEDDDDDGGGGGGGGVSSVDFDDDDDDLTLFGVELAGGGTGDDDDDEDDDADVFTPESVELDSSFIWPVPLPTLLGDMQLVVVNDVWLAIKQSESTFEIIF